LTTHTIFAVNRSVYLPLSSHQGTYLLTQTTGVLCLHDIPAQLYTHTHTEHPPSAKTNPHFITDSDPVTQMPWFGAKMCLRF